MGYFDSLIDFKTTPDGKIIYYPNSFWGKGYLVPDSNKKIEIQKAAKRYWKVAFLSFILVAFSLSASLALLSGFWQIIIASLIIIFAVLATALTQRSIMRLTNGLIESKVRISIQESYSNSAQAMNIFILLGLELISLYFIFVGFQIFSSPQFRDWGAKIMGIFGISLGALFSIAFVYMLFAKIKRVLNR